MTVAVMVFVASEGVSHRARHNATMAATKTKMKVFGLSNVFSRQMSIPTVLQQKNRMFKRTMRF
ncbi:hypothetical protein VIBHAR_06251 [Vibrio campbellii ATCC BAA-1116]|uniref:Uncharacterized protein n=1 Tax=Vibrio campbellii (strain ATCC BAA-1116) TaxID=2902295 RepID=A7N6J9_VIBC1|nr:hypothetical protein VIBHAR_06251 [Vibrio campbellii ATCC BAA-1116]